MNNIIQKNEKNIFKFVIIFLNYINFRNIITNLKIF
jgi:hypothetical protein